MASATAIEWVARIVKSRLEDQPALVVSAMGKTTDRLAEMMQHAAPGSAYSAWQELCRFHFSGSQAPFACRRDRRVGGNELRAKSRELHGLLIYLENGCILTLDLKDQILSFGERLSSEIVAAAFERI